MTRLGAVITEAIVLEMARTKTPPSAHPFWFQSARPGDANWSGIPPVSPRNVIGALKRGLTPLSR